MQTRSTARLVYKMALYRQKHSVLDTARRFQIFDPDGHPSKGLTRLLLNGYEPRRPETRTRLGLPAEIPAPIHRKTINEHLATDRIQDLPAPLLKWALENREEML